MPNPYHDAEGKFCSKNEMREAVNLLLDKGKVDEYLSTR